MDTGERVRSAGRRLADPVESLAQHVARRATELVVEALDVNALLDRIDVNNLLDQIDVDRLLDRVDVGRLIARVDMRAVLSQVDVNEIADQVDVNEIAGRVDVDALLERTEFRAIVTRSSSTIAREGIDLVRSQAVGLDDFFARWVNRLLRRSYTGPPTFPGSPGMPSLDAGQ